MRIVFIGAVDFSQHALRCVLEDGGDVVAVLTLPPDRAHVHSDFADLAPVAAEYGVPLHHVRKTNDPATIELIRSLAPDVIFIFGWSQLVPPEVLSIPRLGCIGTHPTLLPKNRGRHPLIWALVEGLEESGLTFLYLDEGADSGDLLWQRPFKITLEDDAGSLYERIKNLACEAIHEFLPQLEQDTAPRVPQDHAQATYRRKRTEQDGEIDWSISTRATYDLIRALSRPYPGAHTYWNGSKVTVWRAALLDPALSSGSDAASLGTVEHAPDGTLRVRTGDGYLTLVDYETANGSRIPSGARLGDGA